jgi:hypothetical protein
LVSVRVRPIHRWIVHRVLFRCIALGRLALGHKNGKLFHPYHATHLALNYCPSAEKGPRNSYFDRLHRSMERRCEEDLVSLASVDVMLGLHSRSSSLFERGVFSPV